MDPWVRKNPWGRKWQLTPLLLPVKSSGQRSLLGCSPWGHRVGHDWVTAQVPTIPGSYAMLSFTALDLSRHIHSWSPFPLWPGWCALSGALSSFPPLFSSSTLDTFQPGVAHLSVSIFFFFATVYSSWGSHGKYTWVVCHSLLWWITFCQNSPLWPACLWWPCMAWLIASLSYTSPFATRQWIMEGHHLLPYTKVQTNSYGDRKSSASPVLQSPTLQTKCTKWNFQKAPYILSSASTSIFCPFCSGKPSSATDHTHFSPSISSLFYYLLSLK